MEEQKTRIAAVGDIHVSQYDKGKWTDFFRKASDQADMLLLCGDLTDTGDIKEAEVLASEMSACSIPVIAVLGNHDYEKEHATEIRHLLEAANKDVHVLDGECVAIHGIGIAGVKGFGGGFDNYMLSMFGEPATKAFVQTAMDEAMRLERALAHLDSMQTNLKKIVVMHYAPIKETVLGEPEVIHPFLGCSRLAEPLNTRGVLAAFHGHAHIGQLEGQTSAGVKVFNVSKQILARQGMEWPFFVYEV